MKKLTQLVGVFATGLISAATLAGCSSTPDDPGAPMTTAGAGGMGVGGGAGTTGSGGGTMLSPPASYTYLTGADAMPGAMTAPPAWSSKGCTTCHGANGEGFMGLGPEIRHTPTAYATYVVRNGRAPFIMAKFPEMPMAMTTDVSAADLTAILTWLSSHPKPTTGQGLYKDFCGNCHGPGMATGGAVPVNVIGKTKIEITQKVRMGEGTDPAMRNGYMPAEDMAALTDAELTLIQDYLMAK